jgi:hypothetical protein
MTWQPLFLENDFVMSDLTAVIPVNSFLPSLFHSLQDLAAFAGGIGEEPQRNSVLIGISVVVV